MFLYFCKKIFRIMITEEIKSRTKTTSNLKQSSSMSREEFLKDTISFREAIKGFWKKFDNIYGTNLTHEKIRDYDYRNRI